MKITTHIVTKTQVKCLRCLYIVDYREMYFSIDNNYFCLNCSEKVLKEVMSSFKKLIVRAEASPSNKQKSNKTTKMEMIAGTSRNTFKASKLGEYMIKDTNEGKDSSDADVVNHWSMGGETFNCEVKS